MEAVMAIAAGPLNRTMPRSAAPGGELMATMVSSIFIRHHVMLVAKDSSAAFQRFSAPRDCPLIAGNP